MTDENEHNKLYVNGRVKFVADDIQIPTKKGVIKQVEYVAREEIQNPIFSSLYGGPISVEEDEHGKHIPTHSIFSVRATIDNNASDHLILPGVAIIKVRHEAPITAIWRRISAVLIREIDF